MKNGRGMAWVRVIHSAPGQWGGIRPSFDFYTVHRLPFSLNLAVLGVVASSTLRPQLLCLNLPHIHA